MYCIRSVVFLVIAAVSTVSNFAQASSLDEEKVRGIVANLEAERPDPHVSDKLDWENAFGVRYTDLKKRDAFYGSVVKPQFAKAESQTLETKVRFISSTVAIADTYWHIAGQVYAGENHAAPDRWGRTTYVFSKDSGDWVEVMERVADLRVPYYQHFDQIPAATKVPAALLSTYAGHYVNDSSAADVAVDGDHLIIKRSKGTLIAIPYSTTEFRAFFDEHDVAEYLKIRFEQVNGVTCIVTKTAWDADVASLQKR